MEKQRTEAQREASRTNGRKSKRPVTPEGKAKVRFNAVKHGFTAEVAVIEGESQDLYFEMLSAYFEEYGPETTSEALAIEEVAIYTWRLRRVGRYLRKLHAGKTIPNYPEATIAGLLREDRSLQRSSRLALRKFSEIRESHRNDPDNPPAPASPGIFDRQRDL